MANCLDTDRIAEVVNSYHMGLRLIPLVTPPPAPKSSCQPAGPYDSFPVTFTYWLYDAKGRPVVTVTVVGYRVDSEGDHVRYHRGVAICSEADIKNQSFRKSVGAHYSVLRADLAHNLYYSSTETRSWAVRRSVVKSERAVSILRSVYATLNNHEKLQGLHLLHKVQPDARLTDFELAGVSRILLSRRVPRLHIHDFIILDELAS